MKRLLTVVAIAACAMCVEWTRFQGKVKSVNLKASTITIQDQQGDMLTVPVDYQVKIIEKKVSKRLQDLDLDAKVTIIRTPAEQIKDDTEGLVPAKFPN